MTIDDKDSDYLSKTMTLEEFENKNAQVNDMCDLGIIVRDRYTCKSVARLYRIELISDDLVKLYFDKIKDDNVAHIYGSDDSFR